MYDIIFTCNTYNTYFTINGKVGNVGNNISLVILYTRKKYFSDDHFSYNSPYPYLEGIKDAFLQV